MCILFHKTSVKVFHCLLCMNKEKIVPIVFFFFHSCLTPATGFKLSTSPSSQKKKQVFSETVLLQISVIAFHCNVSKFLCDVWLMQGDLLVHFEGATICLNISLCLMLLVAWLSIWAQSFQKLLYIRETDACPRHHLHVFPSYLNFLQLCKSVYVQAIFLQICFRTCDGKFQYWSA